MNKYFIQENGNQKGPYTIDELKATIIKRETPIWCEGMDDWKEAKDIDELKDFFRSTPPPFKEKQKEATPPPFQKNVDSKTEANSGDPDFKVRKKKSNSALVIIIALVLGSALAWVIIDQVERRGGTSDDYSTGSNYETKKQSVAEIEASNPTKFLDADGYYNQNLLGTKLKVDGQIHNNATTTSYKDITVRVYFYAKTGTLLGSEDYTVYEVVKPNHSKSFKLKVTNYSNVQSIGWDVISAKVY